MTQEEKAKAYDEAKARMSRAFNSNRCTLDFMNEIFPELKETEDERIRKEIINYLEQTVPHHHRDEVLKSKEWIAWLEKQNKVDMASYEVAENEKREFVGYGFLKCKGDFLSFKEGENYWLEYVGKDNYNVRSDNLLGQTFHIMPQQLYTVFRPTTWLEKQSQTFTKKDVDDAWLKGIEDTKREIEKQKSINDTDEEIVEAIKDTSVLDMVVGDWVVDNCGYAWKIEGILNQFYILEGIEGGESLPTIEWVNKTFHLWTIQDAKDGDILKEDSCIFILQKLNDNNTAVKTYCALHDDGDFEDGSMLYFDVNSTKPATKEQRDLLFQKMNEAGYEWDAVKKELKKIEQSTAWSKEDNDRINSIKYLLHELDNHNFDDWFKSLKDRVNPKQEWREEDIHNIENIDSVLFYDKDLPEATRVRLRNWLKSLKPQPQQEWSEEDEEIFNKIIQKLDESDNVSHYDYADFEIWLIDLKERLINM